MDTLARLWRAERAAFPLWVPVLIGAGVQLYFLAGREPSGWAYALSLSLPLIVYALTWRRSHRYWVAGLSALLVAIGFAAAGFRAHHVAAPVLKAPLNAAIEGRIRAIGKSEAGRARLVLDEVIIFGLPDADTPARAQVSLQRVSDIEGLAPGLRVSVLAHLSPPGKPVEPGGFDYRRYAWFQQLGAVGYARSAPAVIASLGRPSAWDRAALAVGRWRHRISAWARARLPGEEGAFAAAVMVGDRAEVSPESTEALRAANLAHLLAISGLHMGLVTALVFAAVRLALAATPSIGRRWRVKTIAAMAALLAAVGYLSLSGGSIATQRAFIMAAVALVAVMLNRPAITLRALGVAAIVILMLRPESLTHVGFQMSFAATAAIIAGFDHARARGWTDAFRGGRRGRRLLGYVAALAATSLLAGLATAPYAAFHFNRVAVYGLPANLIAVPVMSLWVAPAGLVAAALAPLGLENAPLWLMGRGISVILEVARFFGGLDGATRPVAAAPQMALTLITIGGLGLCLGRQAFRLAGAALVCGGLAVWGVGAARPEVLILADGRLVGALGSEGRALDRARGDSYAAGQWLRRDGDPATQEVAASRPGVSPFPLGAAFVLQNGWRVLNVTAKRPGARLKAACKPETILVLRASAPSPDGPCLSISRQDLGAGGAHAVTFAHDGPHIDTVAARAGARLWTSAAQ